MSEKRKDNKGRILKTGESQRKDFTYQYRYTASDKKVRYVYAQTLDKLREKEAIIQRDILDGINYKASEATVWDLVSRYMATRRNFSKHTVRAYSSALNHIKSSKIAHRKISEIKQSDAKAWFASLHDSGMRQHTIEVIQNVLRPAFEMAVNDDALRKTRSNSESLILFPMTHNNGKLSANKSSKDILNISKSKAVAIIMMLLSCLEQGFESANYTA